MTNEEIYVSVDMEADGPVPIVNSMLSLGAVAFRSNGEIVGKFEANVLPLPGAVQNPETMAWWQQHPEAWDYLQLNRRLAEDVMGEFAAWTRALPGQPVFVAYPVAFDFAYVNAYFHHFGIENPYGYEGLDVKSYATGVLGRQYRYVSMSQMPRHWLPPTNPHPHRALDDALEQGQLFIRALIERGRAAAA